MMILGDKDAVKSDVGPAWVNYAYQVCTYMAYAGADT